MEKKWSRGRQPLLMRVLLISFSGNLILTIVLGFVVKHPTSPNYYATSVNSQFYQLHSIDAPNQSDLAITRWANEAAIAAFSYNFFNYETTLNAASNYFTPEGWDEFLQTLKESNNLDVVIAKKLDVTAVATSAPIILKKGPLNGTYAWRVQMPILITFQSASEFEQQSHWVTMLIVRVPTLDSPKGIGISQFTDQMAVGGVSG